MLLGGQLPSGGGGFGCPCILAGSGCGFGRSVGELLRCILKMVQTAATVHCWWNE